MIKLSKLLVLWFMMASCDNDSFTANNSIIADVEAVNLERTLCRFYLATERDNVHSGSMSSFIDSCNRWNVGDSIKVVKRKTVE